MVNISFVVSSMMDKTHFAKCTFLQTLLLVITTPIILPGGSYYVLFNHYTLEGRLWHDHFLTTVYFCTCHLAIYCYARFLPFVICIDIIIVKATITIIIKIMIYVTAFRHTSESFINIGRNIREIGKTLNSILLCWSKGGLLLYTHMQIQAYISDIIIVKAIIYHISTF